MESQFLKAQEVGQLLGLKKGTIWVWDSSGKLPRPIRRGKRYTRWHRQEVFDWIAASAAEGDLIPRERWEKIRNNGNGEDNG